MRRIKNSPALKASVEAFNKSLFNNRRRDFVRPLSNLKKLLKEKKLKSKYKHEPEDIKKYVNKIITDYDDILSADGKAMKKLVDDFNKIIPRPIHKDFHEKIVSAMRYDALREVEFPEFLRNMNIKTCVYCHSQATLVIEETGKKWRALLQLDHKYPKSAYPFLCTSFYNLYPICGNCNLSKSDKESKFELYVDDDNLDLLHFALSKKSVVKYWKTKNLQHLEVIMKPAKGSKILVDAYKKMFNIKEIYDLQKDIAEELLHKLEVYNNSYKETLVNSFKKLFPDQSMINRLLIGNYEKSSEMLKRPMAKFVQEIARDIELIPEEDEPSDNWKFLKKTINS
jgi:hypothetical protein